MELTPPSAPRCPSMVIQLPPAWLASCRSSDSSSRDHLPPLIHHSPSPCYMGFVSMIRLDQWLQLPKISDGIFAGAELNGASGIRRAYLQILHAARIQKLFEGVGVYTVQPEFELVPCRIPILDHLIPVPHCGT